MRVLDLCCGMGGLSLAAQQLGMRIVAGVDTDVSVLRTFEQNFCQATVIRGSVRAPTVLAKCRELLEATGCGDSPVVVLSGPPCQGFSAAGSRRSSDPRNQILPAVARAIVKLQPSCALIENVSMILAEKHSARLTAVEETLRDGGYSVARVLLDAGDYGAPQRRKRTFFLVSRVLPDEAEVRRRLDSLKKPEVTVLAALGDLPAPQVRPDDFDDECDYGGVVNHFAMQHSNRVKQKIAKIKPGEGPMSYRRLDPHRPAKTLFSGHRAPPAHFLEPRSITVREAARLQGFPDIFRVYGSFANQMAQVTNAVPPPLTRAVLRVLAELSGIEIDAHA
jgi:DNA (cytosine-5)-methyltransferase 1